MLTASDSLDARAGRGHVARAVGLALAAVAYLAFWAVGLTVWSGATSMAMSPSGVVALYGGAPLRASLSIIFSEGLPAIPLLVLLVAIAFTVRRRGAERAGLVVLVAGIAAVAVSLTECVLGLPLTLVAAPAHDAATAGLLFESLTRLDGVKMLLLAVCALAGSVGPAWRVRALPIWLRVVGVALAVAIITSGIGYTFLIPSLGMAAVASLPLLLLWVSGSGAVFAWRALRT
ncbi:MAG: hypothetical protein LBV34_00035 [Nocardiopsaceae bacterium]|jgi:hypothetical protein|nr:hypothetical protein [Nocardiopsaceae bacterium]